LKGALQLIALGLAFACGVLALFSIALTAGNIFVLRTLTFGHGEFVIRLIGFLAMKFIAIGASIAIFFLVYWLLPNGRVPPKSVLPAAVMMGLLAEIFKYAYIIALPHLNFQEVYGPFALSVSMMFWAFLSGMLLLAGAHVSVQRHENKK
jgi:membrane protein